MPSPPSIWGNFVFASALVKSRLSLDTSDSIALAVTLGISFLISYRIALGITLRVPGIVTFIIAELIEFWKARFGQPCVGGLVGLDLVLRVPGFVPIGIALFISIRVPGFVPFGVAFFISLHVPGFVTTGIPGLVATGIPGLVTTRIPGLVTLGIPGLVTLGSWPGTTPGVLRAEVEPWAVRSSLRTLVRVAFHCLRSFRIERCCALHCKAEGLVGPKPRRRFQFEPRFKWGHLAASYQ